MQGLRGAYHRLWGLIATSEALGDSDEVDQGIAQVRGQFEQLLGRSLTGSEWQTLATDAREHGRRIAGAE